MLTFETTNCRLMNTTRLGIIEDEALVRENLTAFFKPQPDLTIVGASDTVEGFLADAPSIAQLDLLLLDIGLPGMSGIEGIPLLKERFEDVSIIMLTALEDEDKVFSALKAGADSYLLKRTSLQKIREALLVVRDGGSYMSPSIARKVFDHFGKKPAPEAENAVLTPRQREVVSRIMEGDSYKMVAAHLDIKLETVRDHIKKIYSKLQVSSKIELINKMNKNNQSGNLDTP